MSVEKMGILEASDCDRRGFRNEGSGSSGPLVGERKDSVVLELPRGISPTEVIEQHPLQPALCYAA